MQLKTEHIHIILTIPMYRFIIAITVNNYMINISTFFFLILQYFYSLVIQDSPIFFFQFNVILVEMA